MTILTPVSAADTAGAVGNFTRVLHISRTTADTAHATDVVTRSGISRFATATDTAAATDIATRTNIHQSAKLSDTAHALDTNTRVGNKWFAAAADAAPGVDANGTGVLRFLIQWSLDVSQSAARSRAFSATIRVRPAIVPTPQLTVVPR